MKRILYLSSDAKSATAYYRGIGVLGALQRKYNDVDVWNISGERISWNVFSQVDVLFVERPYLDQDVAVIEMAKFNNIPVWIDCDDLVTDVPQDNPASSHYMNPYAQENIKKCLCAADIITVSTEYLKQELSKFNSNIQVIPNAFNNVLFKNINEHKPESNVILYRGSETHYLDLDKYADALVDVINESHSYVFYFLGLNPWITFRGGIKDPSKVVHRGTIDIMHYHHDVRTMSPKAIIVPLLDIPFNRGKSNIAWVEGTFSGAVTLGPAYLDEFVRPGIVNYSDENSFYDSLTRIVKKKTDTVDHHRQSREYIEQNLLLTKVNESRYEILKSLT